PMPTVDYPGNYPGHRRPEPGFDDRAPFPADLHEEVAPPSSFDSRGWSDLTGLADFGEPTQFHEPSDYAKPPTFTERPGFTGAADFTARTERTGTGFTARTERVDPDFTARTERVNNGWSELDGRGPDPVGFDGRGPAERGGYGPTAYRPSGDPHEDTWMGAPPPVGAGAEPLDGPDRSAGPITDQLPRLEVESPQAPPDPTVQVPPPPPHYRPRSGELAAGLGTSAPVAQPGPTDLLVDEEGVADPDQAGQTRIGEQLYVDDQALAPDEEAAADEPASPVREWAVMATQIGVGVVGGAVLWLICEWLWQRIPVVALVVALAVITGLVWVVRHVRRAEDLQTTVIAVLVGLFVTVSPAALLLVGR
ncbi:MAG TPA: hypothetical protein VHH34_09095, partial [Pseudonocardiaceae bacterium]|nr:hypothetical protein [Pseudonocardiaceae bacterium]